VQILRCAQDDGAWASPAFTTGPTDRPSGIAALDQLDLPLSPPALELLLTSDRRSHAGRRLDVDQTVDAVLRVNPCFPVRC
jgi:hypothetical protein